ncbi:MAG TPA: hypothetical protein VEA58_01335 [Anaerovoracaceae bacterium]|nr:hypothetical protein [Anaerovoracaceae bacterium]
MKKMNLDNLLKRMNIKTIGIVLFASLLILTFVSKTIYNYNLPVVTATTPMNGKLDKVETVKGIAEWADRLEVYAEMSGYIEDIYVEEGDRVTKGQALVKMSLTDEERSQNREKSYELQQLEMDIRNEEEDCNILKRLFEEGAIPEKDYREKERNLQSLYAKKQKLLLDYQDTLDTGSLTIYASEDSIIADIPVHKGQKVNDGDLVVTCGLSQNYKINCKISLDNNFVMEGDFCELDNSTHSVDGIVKEVTAEEDGKEISVLIQSDEVMAGETFDVKFEKESAESFTLVPNGALNRDSDGYFLYQVMQREGMLGKEFFVEKQRVYIGDNDAENTVISDGITFFEPIVLQCNKEIEEGDIVILENEGDFFAE